MLPYLATGFLVLATVYAAIVSFRQQTVAAAPGWLFPDNAKHSRRIVIGLATLTIIIGFAGWFTLSARRSSRRSVEFLIPEGYSGWVRVEFEIPGEAPLPVEAGHAVVKIPPSGLLRTSSQEQYGRAQDAYRFYSGTGEGPLPDSGPGKLVWGKMNGEASGLSGARKYEEFFVGTEQQFKSQMKEAAPGDPTTNAPGGERAR